MPIQRSYGFTVVELLIVVIVIAILASISVVAYNGITLAARSAAAQSDLRNVTTLMQLAYQQAGTFPAELPEEISNNTSDTILLELIWSGTVTRYSNLTAVQNGVLISLICQELIAEGAGQGLNQGGAIQNYITGCGNWNRGSMQVTGWNTRVWNTPVTQEQLLHYANTFSSSDTWNASQVGVVQNFYTQLVERHVSRGGVFPVTSFWDSWATSSNGGTLYEALPAESEIRTGYCVEATIENTQDRIWHVDETGTPREGPCQAIL